MPRYLVDASASRIRIEAHSTLHPVVVETSEVAGHLDVDVAADGTVVVPDGAGWILEVPGRALRSGNQVIDRETARRLDWRQHPVIRGELVSVDAGNGLALGEVRLHGDVSLHGQTRRVVGIVAVAMANDGDAITVRGRSCLDVRDFGLKPPRLLVMKVDPDVEVAIDLVARPVGAADA